MKVQIYGKVLKALKSVQPKELKGHSLKRMLKMVALITGMIRYKSSHLAKLGKGLPQQITAHSKEKAAGTFLANKWTDIDTHYLPFLKDMLPGVISHSMKNGGVHLIIDGSQMGNKHCALMVSIAFRKRSIPLLWLVKKQPKGHFEAAIHVDLIKAVSELLLPLLPQGVPVTVLGDGEFDSINLQKFCKSVHWNYVFRTANNTVLYEENGDSFKPKNMSVDKTHNTLFFSNVEFTKQRFKYVNFLLWHHKECEEPLPLISSLDCPLKIMEAYRKRYGIEALFKDLKSTSFNLHKTRLTKAYDISNLIMVAALAFNLLAILAEQFKDNPIRKYIQRIREDKREFSFYTFALELLTHLIDEGLEFCFSTKFSKNFN